MTLMPSDRLLQGIAIATNRLLTIQDNHEAVQSALAALGDVAEVDRIYIFENHPHPDTQSLAMSQRWEWVASGIQPEIDNPKLQNLSYDDFFPRWQKLLSNAQPVVGLVHEFPETEQVILAAQDIQSIIIVPIFIRQTFWGFVGFDDCHQLRQWNDISQSALMALAGSIGGTIAQRDAEARLREANATLEERVNSRTLELQQAKESTEKAMAELAQAQAQLVHQEKLSLMGQMVAGLAHEINNPIHYIMGNISCTQTYVRTLLDAIALLRECCPEDDPVLQKFLTEADIGFIESDFPKILDSMMHGSQRIKSLILSLRQFSRLDEAEYKRVNLHDSIDSTLILLQGHLTASEHRPAIQVVKKYGQLPKIECYAGSINLVLLSILTNAIDALAQQPSGHELSDRELSTHGKNNKNPDRTAIPTISSPDIPFTPQILIDTRYTNNRIIISIADNGPGMSPTVAEKIFEPFFTTKPVGTGVGLSLAISAQIIIKQHNGTLNCVTAPNQGAKFIIGLPLL